MRCPWVVYSDFESIQPPSQINNYRNIRSSGFNNFSNNLNTIEGRKHLLSGAGIYFNFENAQVPFNTYNQYSIGDREINNSEDVMDKYLEELIEITKYCHESRKKWKSAMKELSKEQKTNYNLAKN